MSTTLTELETAVIQRMLADPEVHSALDTLRHLVVEERSFSEVGFMTSFVRNDTARLFPANTSLRWGKVMGRLNGVIDADFVVYVDDGFVSAIEGVTFGGEPWPSTVSEFELTEVQLNGAG